MLTLLLTQRPSSRYVCCRRGRPGQRLFVRLRARSLDGKLARGACPDTSAALSVRAHELIGQAHRRRLAQEIDTLLREVARPTCPHHWEDPIYLRQARSASTDLRELADRLLAPIPVEAAGVAQVELLLRDGASPLYQRARAGELERVVRQALHALALQLPLDDD